MATILSSSSVQDSSSVTVYGTKGSDGSSKGSSGDTFQFVSGAYSNVVVACERGSRGIDVKIDVYYV